MPTALGLPFFIFIALFASVVGFLYWSQRRRGRSAASISDSEFLIRFGNATIASPERILAERRAIARILGVRAGILSPEQTYEDLKEGFEVIGQLSVGWSDLQYELLEKSARFREQRGPAPLTIGAIIHFRLETDRT